MSKLKIKSFYNFALSFYILIFPFYIIYALSFSILIFPFYIILAFSNFSEKTILFKISLLKLCAIFFLNLNVS